MYVEKNHSWGNLQQTGSVFSFPMTFVRSDATAPPHDGFIVARVGRRPISITEKDSRAQADMIVRSRDGDFGLVVQVANALLEAEITK